MTVADPADRQVWETAMALMAQYGDDAEVIATLRAAEYAAMGDVDGLSQWDRVIACLSHLESGGRPPGSVN
jgi:hypothetical protein